MKKQLLIAVLLGVIAAMFTGLYLVSVESTYRISAQKVKVLISKQYINQGAFIDETMVQETLVPKEYIQPKALQSIKDLRTSDGRYLFMAVAPIEQGEQIITTKLSMLGIETGISAVIPTAQRAITIPLDSRVVNGIIKPGNRVDIIGIFEYQDKSSEQQQIALTLLQNVLVLSVGDSVLGSVIPKAEKGKEMISNEQSVSDSISVSFSVNSQEGELLALASEKGTIKLLLRGAGDETIINVKGAKMADISKEMISSQSSANTQHLQDMQKKQKEIISILKKYKQ
ncbi:MAG: Flp pilus assembly protein CpaB [Elusimicrobia bacterium]|nr:Flp pilus assembly protein CpaB [Elusimicrobiota bacterium]